MAPSLKLWPDGGLHPPIIASNFRRGGYGTPPHNSLKLWPDEGLWHTYLLKGNGPTFQDLGNASLAVAVTYQVSTAIPLPRPMTQVPPISLFQMCGYGLASEVFLPLDVAVALAASGTGARAPRRLLASAGLHALALAQQCLAEGRILEAFSRLRGGDGDAGGSMKDKLLSRPPLETCGRCRYRSWKLNGLPCRSRHG